MKIKIDGVNYEDFNDLALSVKIDSVASTFAFTGRYDKENSDHKHLFRPLSFYECLIFDDNDKKIITGTIISHDFNSKERPELVTFSGYSKGGVLEDCSIPYELYPLESLNRSLKDIATRLVNYFGLKLIIHDSVKSDCNLIYQKSVGEPSGMVKDYLSKLTSQRNIVMSHDVDGNIIFTRINGKGSSKGIYDGENTLTMGLSIQGQSFHSKITVLKQPSKGDGAASFSDSIENSLVTAKRPQVSVLTSGEDGETAKGAKNLLAEELKSIKIPMTFERWEDLHIGDLVGIQNPEIFINKEVKMVVEGLSYSQNASSKTMSVSTVLPESFSGDQPKNIFAF